MDAIQDSRQIRYYLNLQDAQPRLTQSGNEKRHLKPLIHPEKTPEMIASEIFKSQNYENLTDYQTIVKHLISYQKGGDNRRWDEYAQPIPQALRDLLSTLLNECRRNGFVAPYVFDGKVIWRRVATYGEQGDLCTLCERDCVRSENVDTGRVKWLRAHQGGYREPKPCWERD